MNYKAIALAGAFTAWILSETVPAVQIWAPAAIVAMLALFVAQKVKA